MRKVVPWVAAVLMLSCGREVVWPAATPQDLNGTYYVVRDVGDGGRIVRVSGLGAADVGVGCDVDSALVSSRDGRRLYFAADGALYLYDLASGRRAEVVKFPAGEARELDAANADAGKVLRWKCRCRFPEVYEGPEGIVAFRIENVVTPLPDAKASDFTPAQIKAFPSRAAFAAEDGLYLLKPGAAPRRLGYTHRLFGFVDNKKLLLEHKMTAAVLDISSLAIEEVLPAGAHELGFLPVGAVAAEKAVVVAAKADDKSDDVLNDVYILTSQSTRDGKPWVTVRAVHPVSRVALSGDGKYAAVEVRPMKYGETTIYAVDLENRVYKQLVVGGRLLGFAPGGRAVYYVIGRDLTGDVYLVGLDGCNRRLTQTGDYVAAP